MGSIAFPIAPRYMVQVYCIRCDTYHDMNEGMRIFKTGKRREGDRIYAAGICKQKEGSRLDA